MSLSAWTLSQGVNGTPGCLVNEDCSSSPSEVCHLGDNKCYSSGLTYEEDCSADNGDRVNARCASGSCRSSDNKCGAEVQVDDSGSFVGWLPCTESYVDGGNIVENAIDYVFAPLEDSPLSNLETPGGSIDLVSVMKDELNTAISDAVGFSVLLPQKVCADSDEDVATRGGNAGVEACESLDMLNDTDVLAFGYYNAGWDKGICVALNDGTHTYALGKLSLCVSFG